MDSSIRAFKPSALFRLTISMAIGILLSDTLGYSLSYFYCCLGALVFIFLLLLLFARLKGPTRYGWFGGGILLFFMLLGGWLAQYAWQQRLVHWQEEEQLYKAYIVEPPVEKRNSYALLAEVNRKQVLLYVDKSEDLTAWRMGQELLFYGTIRAPRNAGNPAEFDYARYLLLRGITGTAWVESGCWRLGANSRRLTLKQHALLMRQKVVESYRLWGITNQNLAVLAALTVGHKEDVTKELRSDYAAAGLSHLLALSGLHVGIIWSCITFLFGWLGNARPTRYVRCILVIIALWIFAFVGGLTPSLVRAVSMCSLVELSRVRNGRVYSLHTLTVAAWGMLLYNPLYLFEVGFQLSFLAVLAIILISPLLTHPFHRAKRWVRYWAQAVAVTLAAQLGTAPLSVYYFSIFPTYFLITNLAVLFLLPFLLFGALFTSLLFFWPSAQLLLAAILNWGLTLLNGIAQGVGKCAYAVWQPNDFSLLHLALLYLLVGWLLFYLYMTPRYRRRSWLFLSGIVLLYGAATFAIGTTDRAANYLLFYNHPQASGIHLVGSDKRSWLVTNSPDSIVERMSYIAATHWKEEGLSPHIIPLYQDSLSFKTTEGLFEWGGKRFCMVTDRRWVNRITPELLAVDYLYLCRGFNGDFSSLTAHFAVGTVLCDASLSRYQVKRVTAECDSLQIPCIDLVTTGSYKVILVPQ